MVFDETQLPLGRLRLRLGGSPGGHRGMESVIQSLRTDRVPRLRLGIGGPETDTEDLVDFVLEPFSRDERPAADEMVTRAAAACECWLSEGAEATMSRYNRE